MEWVLWHLSLNRLFAREPQQTEMSWSVGDCCGFKRSISSAGNAVQCVAGCLSGQKHWYWRGTEKGQSHVGQSGERCIDCSIKGKGVSVAGEIIWCSLLVLHLPSKKFSAAQGAMPGVGSWSSVFPAEPLCCVLQHSDSCQLHGFCGMESYSHFLYLARGASCVGQRQRFRIYFILLARLEKNSVLSKNIACKSV